MKQRILGFSLAAALVLGGTSPALAWGTKGHTMINRLAAAALPAQLPAFVRTPQARAEIAYLGPDLDRLKGSGQSWDSEHDPGHFLDLNDNGTIGTTVSIRNLPPTREAYDTALRAGHTDQYHAGYLPYSLLDGWEQLREDFAYWRVDNYLAAHGRSAQARNRAARDRAVDQQVVLRDIGVWGHFVGDACQPLHVTVHFNGWGNFPNPNGYSESKTLHERFESGFVNKYESQNRVAALVGADTMGTPTTLLTQPAAMNLIVSYLLATSRTVPELYRIEKTNGFANGSAQAVTFTAARLAAGASELRDLVVLAWQDSAYETVGYPSRSVRSILNGSATMQND